MFQCVRQLSNSDYFKNSGKELKLVRFTNFDFETFDIFEKEMKRLANIGNSEIDEKFEKMALLEKQKSGEAQK